MTQELSLNDLRAGDVLLSLGFGPVSQLIAWFGDSIYSHVALVVDDKQLIEAATSGVRYVALAERIRDVAQMQFIDVYRPSDNAGHKPTKVMLDAMRERAAFYNQTPYATDNLVQLGVASAVRNKMPDRPGIRLVIRMILNKILQDDPTNVVCSELVYRCLAEAKVKNLTPLKPTIMVSSPLHSPFPEIDVPEFIREVEHILGKPVLSIFATAPSNSEEMEEQADELEGLFAQVRNKLTKTPPLLKTSMKSLVPIVPDPNPKTILPVDLETSPNLRLLGRLRLQAAE
jgi:hypothetical protein